MVEKDNIQSLHLDEDYSLWLAELKSRYHNAQLKAAVKVNSEKLQYNWQLGAELVMKRAALMQESSEKNPGAMAAVLKLDDEAVEGLCREIGDCRP